MSLVIPKAPAGTTYVQAKPTTIKTVVESQPQVIVPFKGVSVDISKFIQVSEPTDNEFIGVIGAPGVGKTSWATGIPALDIKGFPNPLILDFDRKVAKGFETIPFWNDDFVRSVCKTKLSQSSPPNRRDALIDFLESNGKYLSSYTIILDSWTAVQAAYDLYTDFERPRELAKGVEDKTAGYAFYRNKIAYSEKICALLRGIPTTSIITVHEMVERTEKGDLTGGIRPLMDGKFADAMAGKFTDFIRIVLYPNDLDFDTGNIRKVNNMPVELTGNHGHYIQMVPTRVFTPVIGHNKIQYLIKNKLSYIPATYEAWKTMTSST